MTWYSKLPKVELHVHLEGAIPHGALFDLIQKYGGDLSIPSVTALARRFKYKNFAQFIELCPVSNVRTGVVSTIAEHPIREYFERRLIIGVNTDDPMMSGTPLDKQYDLLVQECGFKRQEICRLILLGIESSWLSEDRKKLLATSFEKEPSWVG
jgi:adenosine deaminase